MGRIKRSIIILVAACISILNANGKDPQDTLNMKPRSKKSGTKILVMSDLNSAYGSVSYSKEVTDLVAQIPNIKPDLILIPGDMVAGQKASLTEENIKSMWASFRTHVLSKIDSMKVPLGITVGNHDASPSFKTDRRIADEFWKANKAQTNLNFGDDSHFPFYYSYLSDDIFFISWDAAASTINEEVFAWMEKQLSSKAAKRARLRIVMGHLPLFAIVESKNKPGEVISDPEQVLELFNRFSVDLYISGHQHAFYPARRERLSLLNSGCVGDGPRSLIGTSISPKKTYTVIDVPRKRPGNFTYKTFLAEDHKLLDDSELPKTIQGFNGISILDSR